MPSFYRGRVEDFCRPPPLALSVLALYGYFSKKG